MAVLISPMQAVILRGRMPKLFKLFFDGNLASKCGQGSMRSSLPGGGNLLAGIKEKNLSSFMCDRSRGRYDRS